jgi:hypothetical protein
MYQVVNTIQGYEAPGLEDPGTGLMRNVKAKFIA